MQNQAIETLETKKANLLKSIAKQDFATALEILQTADIHDLYELVHHKGRLNKTLIHLACESCFYFLSNGEKNKDQTDIKNKTALIIEFIKFLIKEGLTVNLVDDSKETALMLAVRAGNNPEVVQFLMDSGADFRAKDDKGNNLFHLLLSIQTNTYKLAATLLSWPGCHELLIQIDNHGQLPLSLVFAKGFDDIKIQRKVVKLILNEMFKHSYDVILKNDFNENPLHWAVLLNLDNEVLLKLIRFLRENDCLDDQDLQGNTPLHIAAAQLSLLITNIQNETNGKTEQELKKICGGKRNMHLLFPNERFRQDITNYLMILRALLDNKAHAINLLGSSNTDVKTQFEGIKRQLTELLKGACQLNSKLKSYIEGIQKDINKLYAKIEAQANPDYFAKELDAKLKHIEGRYYAFDGAYEQIREDEILRLNTAIYDEFYATFRDVYKVLVEPEFGDKKYEQIELEKAIHVSKVEISRANQREKQLRQNVNELQSLLQLERENNKGQNLIHPTVRTHIEDLIKVLEKEIEATKRHLNFYKELMQRAYDVSQIMALRMRLHAMSGKLLNPNPKPESRQRKNSSSYSPGIFSQQQTLKVEEEENSEDELLLPTSSRALRRSKDLS